MKNPMNPQEVAGKIRTLIAQIPDLKPSKDASIYSFTPIVRVPFPKQRYLRPSRERRFSKIEPSWTAETERTYYAIARRRLGRDEGAASHQWSRLRNELFGFKLKVKKPLATWSFQPLLEAKEGEEGLQSNAGRGDKICHLTGITTV